MGSVLETLDGHEGPGFDQVNGALSIAQTKEHDIVSMEVVGVCSEPASPSTPTTTTAEILLISWLIVLLRTRDDCQVSYEWAYKTDNGAEGEPFTTMRLSTSEVMPDLNSTIEQVASAIAGNVSTAFAGQPPSVTVRGSLLLSTGSLSLVNAKSDQDEVGNQLFDTHTDQKH
jgi:hypothetical protein